MRRVMCVLFTAALLLSLGLHSAAAEETGSIRIVLASAGDGICEGTLKLYKAGEPTADGYRLDPAFGGGIVKTEDADSPALAQWLAEQTGKGGTSCDLRTDGSVEFTDLEEGLYLLVQTETAKGYYPIVPFLVTLPYEGLWHLQANPKVEIRLDATPLTGQEPTPIIAAAMLAVSGTGLLLCAVRKRKK